MKNWSGSSRASGTCKAEHRADLLKLAAERGEKREAIQRALKLEGTFSERDASDLRQSIAALREKWR